MLGVEFGTQDGATITADKGIAAVSLSQETSNLNTDVFNMTSDVQFEV